jgi:3-hydroxyanthranilate 3,4-dioxygenase
MNLNAMIPLDLDKITAAIASGSRPNQVLWQTEDSIAFVARGRVGRSEFHVDPSDEVMYMVKGDMALHYRTPEGEEKVLTVRQGEIMHCPAGTPHSPRFAPDAFVLVMERKRRPEERDRFLWYCPGCGAQLYEAARHVADYRDDPVSHVYEEFYGHDAHRTCRACGHIAQRPI